MFKKEFKKLRVLLAKLLVLTLVFSSVLGTATYAAVSDNNDSVSITLGETPVENGIHAWPGDNSDGLKTGVLEGKNYWQTDKASGNPATVYFYMNVDDNYIFNNTDQRVQVTVEYYDEGDGSIVLQYDAASVGFKDAPLFHYTNTKTWKTYTFELSDAKFANRTNGGDFRVGIEGAGASASTNQDLKLASVTVKQLPSYAGKEKVNVSFGGTPSENGIHAWPGDDPSGLKTGILSGKSYWMTDKTASTFYFYMNLDDSFVYDNTDCDMEVAVEYYDEGNGSMVLQYDADSAPFKDAPVFQYTDTGTWKNQVFKLSDAKFSNRSNGGDFRIGIEGAGASAASNQDLKVASVTVTKIKRAVIQPKTTVIKTKYQAKDVVISNYNAEDFGAVGDGQTDCTRALQNAIDAAANIGGGTVFVPAGTYKVLGNLNIKTGVTLRGDWTAPTEKTKAVKGTIIAAYADKGNGAGTSLIRMQQCSGLTNLSVWYPEQNLENPQIYPWTIEQVGGDSVTVENVTLVNSYNGIKIGPNGNELHYVTNLYGTALHTGIYVDMTTDIGRLQQIKLSPVYWANSGLSGAPDSRKLTQYTTAHAEGLVMGRSDWEYMSDISISGFLTGMRITKSATTGETANAQLYKINIDNCNVALKLEGVNTYGLLVSDSSFEANAGTAPKAIYATSGFNTVAQFNDCTIEGTSANNVVTEGAGVLSFENCTFDGWDTKTGYAIDAEDGSIILGQCTFDNASRHLLLGENADLVNSLNSGHKGVLKVENKSIAAELNINRNDQIELERLPKVKTTDIDVQPKPGSSLVIDITAAPYNADKTGKSDVSEIIRSALAAAQNAGGGTVYLPAGKYLVSQPVTVPTKVELRGSWDVPHHTVGGGTVIYTDYGNNAENTASPLISLEKSSGVRGLSIYYYKVSVNNITPFPWTIQGLGRDVYVINTTLPNSYKGIDFGTYDTTGHYIDYAAGSPLKIGIYVGNGAKNGIVRNVQFNPHYWGRAPGDYPNIPDGDGFNILWSYQKDNLDAFKIGKVSNEIIFDTFVYGSQYGMHFAAEDGKGPEAVVIGHGTDGSKKGIYVEGAAKDGITMINTELVSLSTTDKVYITVGDKFNSKARFFNTSMWGDTNRSVDVSAGKLIIQQANFTVTGQTGINALGGESQVYDSYFQQGNTKHVYAGPDIKKLNISNNLFKGGIQMENRAIGKVTGTNVYPVTVELIKNSFEPSHPEKATATLRLTNVTDNKPISGTIELLQPYAYQNTQKSIRFEGIEFCKSIDIKLPLLACDLLKFKVTLANGYTYATSAKLGQAFAERADMTALSLAPLMTVDSIDQYSSTGGKWEGKDDLSLTSNVKWDDKNLYVTVNVKDNIQYNTFSNGDIWQGDSIQLGIDLSRQSGASSKNVSELGFALNNDGTVIKWRWAAPAGLSTGALTKAQAAIIRDEGKKETVYNITIPFSELHGADTAFNPGNPIGFSLLVNENDGAGRSGFMEFNQGIGNSKDFTQYGDLYLLDGQFLTSLVQSAQAAVQEAIAQKTVSKIDAARNYVNLLPDSEVKTQLTEKLAGIGTP